jgi:predicted class III extradiol MEMO1 family dioxygenase
VYKNKIILYKETISYKIKHKNKNIIQNKTHYKMIVVSVHFNHYRTHYKILRIDKNKVQL